MRIYFFAFICFLSGCMIPPSKVQTYQFKNSKVVGRSYIEGGKLALVTTAAHTGLRFDGDVIQFAASAAENASALLQYTLDGELHTHRIVVTGTKPQTIEIKTLKKGRHELWIYKCSEAITGPLYLHTASGQKVVNIEDRSKIMRIEFIGNSITCGAAADTSLAQCGTKPYEWYHNGYMSYAAQVGRSINANYVLNSVSGAGVYRNWNSDGPTLPQLYDYTRFNRDTLLLNHVRNDARPIDMISIALGTNDFSLGDGVKERKPFDTDTFINTYTVFINKLKLLHPNARIALIDSPMQQGDTKVKLNQCLLKVKNNIDKLFPLDKPVSVYTFKSSYRGGCTTHPSVAEHTKMAEEILPFYKLVLGFDN